MHTLRLVSFFLLTLFGLGGLASAQSTTLWWTGLQDRIGGGPGSPSRNFRMTETIPGDYYPTPGNGNGISSNEAAVFDLIFDTALMEGANKSMAINRDHVKLGTLTLNAAPFDGFVLTDRAGETRGTTLSGGVIAPGGLHRIEQVGTDSWALTADTVWETGAGALVLLSMPLTGNFGLTKTGPGILALSGVQSFTGGVLVEAGILGFQNRAAQPPSGTTTVASGATLGIGLGGAGFFSAADIGQLSANTFSRVNLLPGALIGLETTVSNFTYAGSLGGSHGLAKLGLQTLLLTGTHTYSGPTEVFQGTLYLEGATAAASPVTVHPDATLGGAGVVGGDLHFRAGGRLVFDPERTLQVGGTVSFEGPFGVDQLYIVDGTAPLGTYRLIEGTVDLTGVQNVGVENAGRISLTRFGYFQDNDGLELVLVEDGGAPPGLDGVPGSVVYWRVSPFNRFFGSNRIYTTSPSIVALPNGDYLIAFNLFGGSLSPPASDSGTTLLFRSTDRGATWAELPSSPMMDMKRGSLFVQGDDVYIYGYRAAPGQVIIRRSSNGGETWTPATQLTSNTRGGTPHNPVFWTDESGQERLWAAIGGSRLLSGRSTDLLNASNWSGEGSAGNRIEAEQPDFGSGVSIEVASEAQIVGSPQTGVVVMPKVQMGGVSLPYFSYSLLYRRAPGSNREVQDAGFDEWVALPGAEKKFAAGYDPASGRFYVLSNPVLPVDYGHNEPWNLIRNTAALISSEDLLHWDVEQIFLYSPNVAYEAFQYLNFDIEGDDMLVVSRTAFDIGLSPLPPRGHDSNLVTFHRIENFREAAPDHYLRVHNGSVERWERTQHEPAPLGVFTLGESFAGAPLGTVDGLAHSPAGDILVREAGGRVLRFDESGNFLGLGSAEGLTFASELDSIPPPPRGERTWIDPAGGPWEGLAYWLYWGRPDTDAEIATFGSALTADAAIDLDRTRVVKGLRFRSPHRYTIEGAGSLRLRSANGTALVEALEGHHRVEVPVVLESETRFETAVDAGVDFRGGLRLNGRTARLGGAGEIRVGGLFDMEGGTLEVRGAAGLAFLADTTIRLSGTLAWVPEAGYVFARDDAFQIFAEGALAGAEGAFDEILLPDLGEGFSWDTSALLTSGELKLIGPSTALSIRSFSMAPGMVTLEIDGPGDRAYSIETSTDLAGWSTLESFFPASLPFFWTSTEWLPDPQRFYRVRVEP
ncbi:MAG: autotransporter-associated beta strand repeat-containing protein [Opitutales bacterium]|nr:autotransporter-associated beta strand repeat-containing protein [Opitutales bacterium]